MSTKKSYIAQIHIAKKQLGMDDDTYRALLSSATGKTSCSDMNISQLGNALHAMKQRGFKPARAKSNKQYGPKSRAPGVDREGREYNRKSQGDKIRLLWIKMADDGIVQSGSESALCKYVQRMSNGRYQAPQWCDVKTATRIIESLKQWRKRAEAKTGAANETL